MADTAILPKPAKRKGFKPRDVDNRFAAQAGRCAACRCDLNLSGYERDHIQRHDALGETSFENLQLLCPPCHSDKTRVDNREAKKGARIRGEKGQRARREKRGHGLIKSRGFSTPLIATRESRDPDAAANGGKRMQSRGSLTHPKLKRTMSGKVVARD